MCPCKYLICCFKCAIIETRKKEEEYVLWEKNGKHTLSFEFPDRMGQTFCRAKDVSAKRATCCYYLLSAAKFMANHIHFVIYFGFRLKGFKKKHHAAAKGFLRSQMQNSFVEY